MAAPAANGVGSGDTVSPQGAQGGDRMGFSEETGRAPGGRYVLASAPLGARPMGHQGMRGETSRPSHPWLITHREKSRAGTANVHWEVREACRPPKGSPGANIP